MAWQVLAVSLLPAGGQGVPERVIPVDDFGEWCPARRIEVTS